MYYGIGHVIDTRIVDFLSYQCYYFSGGVGFHTCLVKKVTLGTKSQGKICSGL